MNTNEAVGRNEPCPCGSGKKFKVCCGRRPDMVPSARRSSWLIGGLAVVGLVVVAMAAVRLGEQKPTEATRSFSPPAPLPPPIVNTAGSATPIIPQPVDPGAVAVQPPGPAPEGKVWSAEHGHYHDAPGATVQDLTVASGAIDAAAQPVDPGAFTLQPADPGAPMPQAIPTPTPTPQPDGPVPEGKVWSAEHGHWHDAPPPGTSPPK